MDNNNKEVFILGTGFLKAIHNKIPLLNQLSKEITNKINWIRRHKDGNI